MYCNKEIELSDKASGRWLPYNMDGSAQQCKNNNKNETKKVETKSMTVEARLERLEAFFFKEGDHISRGG